VSSDEAQSPRRYGLPRVRRAALERLAHAYGDDDLELEDYEHRAAAVESAESVEEIARVMSDVPDFDVDTITRGPVARRTADVPAARDEGTELPTAVQILGDRTLDLADFRNGGVRVVGILGDTHVDLRELGPGETAVVEDFSLLGDFTVVVPAGTEVVRHRLVILGDMVRRGPKKSEARRWKLRSDAARAVEHYGAPRLILRGFRLLGDTRIIDV
jgi:hypothetical protein